MSDSGISWAICKSAPHSRQITTPATHHSVFYRPDALPAAQATASKHWIHNLTQNTCIVNNSTWWRRTPERRWHWVVPAPPATLRWWSHQTCPWSARGCDLARSTDTNTSPQSSPEHPAQTPANLEKTALDRGSRSDRLCYCVHTRRWNSTTCHAARLATLARSWRRHNGNLLLLRLSINTHRTPQQSVSQNILPPKVFWQYFLNDWIL